MKVEQMITSRLRTDSPFEDVLEVEKGGMRVELATGLLTILSLDSEVVSPQQRPRLGIRNAN